jgi:hypothetical protein
MHPRKEEARQRADANKVEAKVTAQRAKEDASWVDSSKEAAAKIARAQSREEKEAEATRRAHEKRELIAREEQEIAAISNKKGLGPAPKIKRSDIRISALTHTRQSPET